MNDLERQKILNAMPFTREGDEGWRHAFWCCAVFAKERYICLMAPEDVFHRAWRAFLEACLTDARNRYRKAEKEIEQLGIQLEEKTKQWLVGRELLTRTQETAYYEIQELRSENKRISAECGEAFKMITADGNWYPPPDSLVNAVKTLIFDRELASMSYHRSEKERMDCLAETATLVEKQDALQKEVNKKTAEIESLKCYTEALRSVNAKVCTEAAELRGLVERAEEVVSTSFRDEGRDWLADAHRILTK